MLIKQKMLYLRRKAKLIVVENMIMNVLVLLKNNFLGMAFITKRKLYLPRKNILNFLFTKIKHLYLNSNTKFLLLDTYIDSKVDKRCESLGQHQSSELEFFKGKL